MTTRNILEARVGGGTWTPYAKRQCALSMYSKGKSFLGAAILVRQAGGYEYVVLHLLCQGIEIVLKAILLIRNFDRYSGKLKRYGHDLGKLSAAVITEFDRLKPIGPALATELAALNSLYSTHRLR